MPYTNMDITEWADAHGVDMHEIEQKLKLRALILKLRIREKLTQDALAERVGVTTANSYLDLVGQFLKHAIRKGLLTENPLRLTDRVYGNGKNGGGEPDDTSIVGYACPTRN